MKGIILAGGSGTRLYPSTISVSKQLIPIYDKPMIYYPLSVLMLAGINEVLIISTPTDIDNYKKLLGDGSQLGMKFEYIIQPTPGGLAQAFILGDDYLDGDTAALVLGDNIFHSSNFSQLLHQAKSRAEQGVATLFGTQVKDPSRFGVAEIVEGQVKVIYEKPVNPPSNIAITGLYFYPGDVCKIANTLVPSKRNELEITDLNNQYIKRKSAFLEILPRGAAWLDTGTPESLLSASNYVKSIEDNSLVKVACIEEIAWSMDWISDDQLLNLSSQYKNSYGDYLRGLVR